MEMAGWENPCVQRAELEIYLMPTSHTSYGVASKGQAAACILLAQSEVDRLGDEIISKSAQAGRTCPWKVNVTAVSRRHQVGLSPGRCAQGDQAAPNGEVLVEQSHAWKLVQCSLDLIPHASW